MRRGTVITLGASAVFGIVAVFMARGLIDRAVNTQYAQRDASQIKPVKAVQTQPVLVASLDLSVGDTLSPQHLRLAEYPVEALPVGSFGDFDLLFSDPQNPPVVLVRMTQNEPVLEFKISGPGGHATLSTMIQEGMRAVSIRITDVTGVSGFIKPGDAVDILLTQEVDQISKPNKGRQNTRGNENYKVAFTTGLLVQNVRVLGVGAQRAIETGNAETTKTLTLEVSHTQAQKLALASSVGSLSMALRSIGSEEATVSRTLTMSDLNTGSSPTRRTAARNKSVAIKPAHNTASVTVIRNGNRDQVTVFKEDEKQPHMAGGSL